MREVAATCAALSLDYEQCGDPRARPDPVGGSELKPGDTWPKPLNQIHLTNTFHFFKCFHFQLFAEAISFWGEPINSYKFNEISLQNMHLTKDGILCRLKQNIQNRVRL